MSLYAASPQRARDGKGDFTMYGTGRGLGLATGAGGTGAVLAMTGFPMAGFVVLGMAMVVLGLALVRFAGVRRSGGTDRTGEKGHLGSARRD